MRFPSAFLLPVATIGAASAFVLPKSQSDVFLSLSMADNSGFDDRGSVQVEVKNLGSDRSEANNRLPKQSQSIPFMKQPQFLDGTLAGDVGFDPMGFADSKSNLMLYREAEIKHARLAMLAAAGWPLSELFDKPMAEALGMSAILDDAGRVPSVLNGGMGLVAPAYWGFCILLAGAIDGYSMAAGPNKNGIAEDSIPGNLGFDPFGLYPKKAEDRKWMETAEIKNGRLAMLAITGFALQEFVTHTAVVDQTPFFFKPIWDTLGAMTPEYIIPEGATSVLESVAAPSSDVAATTAVESVKTIVESFEVPADIVPPTTDVAVTTSLESVTNPSAAPPSDAAADVNFEEQLVEAKKRIADLESKLENIRELSR